MKESRLEKADDRIPNTSQVNYTYIVKCSDETLYTGWTNDLEKRLQAHQSGKGAKYTKTRRPVTLLYFETFATKQEAMSREYAIKQLKREQKEQLMTGHTLSKKDKKYIQRCNETIHTSNA